MNEMTNKEAALILHEIIRRYLIFSNPRGSGKTQNITEQMKYIDALTKATLLLENMED